jgi:hypothetical protein
MYEDALRSNPGYCSTVRNFGLWELQVVPVYGIEFFIRISSWRGFIQDELSLQYSGHKYLFFNITQTINPTAVSLHQKEPAGLYQLSTYWKLNYKKRAPGISLITASKKRYGQNVNIQLFKNCVHVWDGQQAALTFLCSVSRRNVHMHWTHIALIFDKI